MSEEKRNILNTINSPDDLKKVPEDDLIQLCKELREKIIDECSEHPGLWCRTGSCRIDGGITLRV